MKIGHRSKQRPYAYYNRANAIYGMTQPVSPYGVQICHQPADRIILKVKYRLKLCSWAS